MGANYIHSRLRTVTPEHFSNARSRRGRAAFLLRQPGQRTVFNLRAGFDQRLDYRNIVDPRVTVDSSPHRLPACRPAVDVLLFERSASFQEQLDRIQLSANHGPVQAGLSDVRLCAQIYAPLQQEIDDAISAILTGPREACLHLRFRRTRFQTAVFVEEAFDQIEPSHSGRSFAVQSCAAPGEKHGGLPPPVTQAAVDD